MSVMVADLAGLATGLERFSQGANEQVKGFVCLYVWIPEVYIYIYIIYKLYHVYTYVYI